MNMNAYRIDTVVNPDGTLFLKDMPFQPGDEVEVIVIERPPAISPKTEDQYSLRGKPFRYDSPTEPVAFEEWNALQ